VAIIILGKLRMYRDTTVPERRTWTGSSEGPSSCIFQVVVPLSFRNMTWKYVHIWYEFLNVDTDDVYLDILISIVIV
jgi:hypothetical protein